MNSCNFVGRLTRDVDLRYTGSNTAVAEIGLAVNDRAKVNGEWTDKAHFFDLVAFKGKAEAISKHFRKGDQIAATCKATLDQWEDRQTGAKRSKVKFLLMDFDFVGSRGGGEFQPQTTAPPTGNHAALDEEDVPFAPDGAFGREWMQ